MITKQLRSTLKPGTRFSLWNDTKHICIVLEDNCPWIKTQYLRKLMHLYTPTGSISWMEDREVFVHDEL